MFRIGFVVAPILICLSFTPVLAATHKKSGQIIAYQTLSRLAQLASFVENHEIFLFAPRSPKEKQSLVIYKVVYRHFGVSDIPQKVITRRSSGGDEIKAG